MSEPINFLGSGTVIEEYVSERLPGLLPSGGAATFQEVREARRELLRGAMDDLPEHWRVYDGLQDDADVIEGPRAVRESPRGEQLLRDLKARYGRGADRAGVVNAASLRALVNEIFNAFARDAERTGADPQQAWKQALDNDADLREAVARS